MAKAPKVLRMCGGVRAECGRVWAGRQPALLGVALRAQPVDLARAVQPVVAFGLAGEPLDVAILDAGVFRDDLPLALGDAVQLEGDFRFGHAALWGRFEVEIKGGSEASVCAHDRARNV